MRLIINGQPTDMTGEQTIASVQDLLTVREFPVERIAVALNGQVIPRAQWPNTPLSSGDHIDIVHAVGGGSGPASEPPRGASSHRPQQNDNEKRTLDQQKDPQQDPLVIAGETFYSRLFVGTGKFPDAPTMVEALEHSGTEMVTMAIRLMNLQNPDEDAILPYLDRSRFRWLPNTAGAYTAEQAITLARLAREVTGTHWVKLEVIGDRDTLWPDTAATIEATRVLTQEGFVVLPYTSPDLVAALQLEDAGAATVMPLASPIGSGQGFIDWSSIERIVARAQVPVVVDAGIGAPSDAALAMELGCDAVLVNTAIAKAQNPPQMAAAMAQAVQAGRSGYRAGRIPKGGATPSSPTSGVVA